MGDSEGMMQTNNTMKAFLSLVCLGIGHKVVEPIERVDWSALRALADEQGLSAIVLDGIEKLPEEQRPKQEVLLEWIGEVLLNFENRYYEYCHTMADMASFYNSHGFKMMILKGYACGLDWPNPIHRPYGDIDIWQFGKQKEADAIVAKEKGFKIDNSHHHHTVFNWGKFTVENHYDFLNVHHHKSNVELEKKLKEYGHDDTHCSYLSEEKLYLPSPSLHALFLLRHASSQFSAEGITIRHILDWGFFVKKHHQEVNWDLILDLIDKSGMRVVFDCYNAICVENLGFSSKIFPYVQFLPILKERVLSEIIFPKYSAVVPKFLIPRLIYKIRRWNDNRWKHEICFKDSRWSAFWSGVWSHLMKPSTI